MTRKRNDETRRAIQRIALFSVMLALACALSAFESALILLPQLPGVKPGLSNVIVMYFLFYRGKGQAALLAFLKSMSVMLLRGFTAGVLSLCGGMASIGAVILLLLVFDRNRDNEVSDGRLSYLALSVTGAVCHNAGQLAAASLLMRANLLLYYFPVLAIAGVVMGCVTGAVLRVLIPAMGRIEGIRN